MNQFSRNQLYFSNIDWTGKKVGEEVVDGLNLLNEVDKSVRGKIVTIFGSHKVQPGNEYYEDCKELAYELGQEGHAIITGGGPGIMEAANVGAMDALAPSVGLQASLISDEQVSESNFTHRYGFHFMFVRRFILAIKSQALIFYPGGYGTLNELFEYATVIQTKMVDKVPMICVNEDYWRGLFDWIKDNPLKENFLKHHMTDLQLLKFVDSHEDVLEELRVPHNKQN